MQIRRVLGFVGAAVAGAAVIWLAIAQPSWLPINRSSKRAEVSAPQAGGLPLRFIRTVTRGEGARTETCLLFDEALAPREDVHRRYIHVFLVATAEQVRLNPSEIAEVEPKLRVDGLELCLSGLESNAHYLVRLAEGMPAASGRVLADRTDIDLTGGTAEPVALRLLNHWVMSDSATPEVCLLFDEPLSTSGVDYRSHIQSVRLTDSKGLAATAAAEASQISVRVKGAELCVTGFQYASKYRVRLAKGTPAASGNMLAEPGEVEVEFGDADPAANFAGRGFLLPRHAVEGVPIETINVNRLGIKVLRLSDRLLVGELRNLWHQRDFYRYELKRLEDDRMSLVWAGEMSIEGPRNQKLTTLFPFAEAVKERKPGAYLVVIQDSSNDERGQLAQWVIDTDLVLSTIQGADGLRVTARSLTLGRGVAGATISLISQGNDILAKAKTDSNGDVVFAPGLLRGRGAAQAMLVQAEGPNQDFTILELAQAPLDLSEHGIGGRPVVHGFDAYLYVDRGVYRPGEAVQLVALLRDGQARAVEGQRATIVVRRPNGTEFKRWTIEATGIGAYQSTVALPSGAARGLWTAQFHLDPQAEPIGRVQFEVQDFVPQRVRMTLSAAPDVLQTGRDFAVDLQSDFLYGAPGADLSTEADVRIEPDSQPFADFAGYRFGRHDDPFTAILQSIESTSTDAKGHAVVTWTVPTSFETTLPLKATVAAGVFEPGGRSTKGRISRSIRHKSVMIGIRPGFEKNLVRENDTARFDIVALASDGVPMGRTVEVTVFHEDRDYQWYRSYGRWQYESLVREHIIAAERIELQAGRPTVFAKAIPAGRVRIEVRDLEGGHVTSYEFRSGWQGTGEVDAPDRVDVTVERAGYKVGEQARLFIKGPTAGWATVSVATDRVLHSQTVKVPIAGAHVSVPVTEAWGSGAYVLVSLHRPLKGGRLRDPVRAMGVAWIPRDIATRVMKVRIDAPAKVESRRKVELAVKIDGVRESDPAYVTVAAVDEGILQLTSFASPNPVGHYFDKHALGVAIRDNYAQLLLGAGRKGTLRSGGDAAGGESLSVVPTRTVALFSGLVKVGPDGIAHISVDVPDYNGQIRLMAVAHSRSRMGQAEARMEVRDPVVAELALPRFLAPSDEAQVTLTLHNLEGPAGVYAVQIDATDAVSTKGPTVAQYTVAAGERLTAPFWIKANKLGVGEVRLTLSGPDGVKVARSWPIAVRSSYQPMTFERHAAMNAGESFTVPLSILSDFEQGAVAVAVTFNSTRGPDVPALLQSLDRYPYGCTEQLTSIAMPLLFFDDPNLLGLDGGRRDVYVRARVQGAIDVLLERQDESGEFGLWRAGDQSASPYLVMFAIDFLTLAHRRGYNVPSAALANAHRWIDGRLTESRFGGQSATRMRPYEAGVAAYGHYLVAREWQANVGLLRTFSDDDATRIDNPIAFAQLGAALATVGDLARAKAMFERAEASIGSGVHWDYYQSAPRDAAAVVALAYEAKRLDVAERARARLQAMPFTLARANTQEKAWMLRAASAIAGNVQPEIAINGTKRVADRRGPVALAPTAEAIAAGYELRNLGTETLSRGLVVRGTPRRAPPAAAEGYTIAKAFYSLDGQAVDPGKVRQNDRVIVVVTGELTTLDRRQAVVVDLLPSGWEIETLLYRNRSSAFSFLPDLSDVNVEEARDDRFVASFDIGSTGSAFWPEAKPDRGSNFAVAYIARAVTVGQFSMPAAVVEDMYQPTLTARTETGRAIVTQKH